MSTMTTTNSNALPRRMGWTGCAPSFTHRSLFTIHYSKFSILYSHRALLNKAIAENLAEVKIDG